MTSPVEVRDLRVSFAGSPPVNVLQEAELTLNPGETVALLGESGSGKSMTSLALMRLLPEGAAFGETSEVWLGDVNLLNLQERVMRRFRGRRIAMVFQEPMTALNPVKTIGEQLAESLYLHTSLSPKEVQARMLELMLAVEMPNPAERLRHYPHQLSGGQKQRVVIAMALACNPDILVADEPTTALDVTLQAQILALLKRLQQRFGMSMLLVTHDLGVVKAVADRVYVLYAGEIVEAAPAVRYFQAPHHPYSRQLMASLPGLQNRAHWLAAIPGSVPAADARPSGCAFHPRCAYVRACCKTDVPALQVLTPGVAVRCHWYPDPGALPEVSGVSSPLPASSGSFEEVLSVREMVVEYRVRRGQVFRAVDGVSLELKRGETLALVGESGCGKTTLSRALLGLLPMHAGSIRFEGREISPHSKKDMRAFRREVQVIFQDPFGSMNPRMTIADILAEGLRAEGMKARAIDARLLVLLDAVNLPKSALTRYPHQFSGGQRQRICIARALATDPSVLICDEPTSALDMSVQAQILNLIKTLQQETGIACLFITHNMAVVSWLADRVMVMQQGRIVEANDALTLLQHPQHPYTRELLAAVPGV